MYLEKFFFFSFFLQYLPAVMFVQLKRYSSFQFPWQFANINLKQHTAKSKKKYLKNKHVRNKRPLKLSLIICWLYSKQENIIEISIYTYVCIYIRFFCLIFFSRMCFFFLFVCFVILWNLIVLMLSLLTATHSHFMQYITPNGGPKSAYHVEPSSRNVLPNWHSDTVRKKWRRKK